MTAKARIFLIAALLTLTTLFAMSANAQNVVSSNDDEICVSNPAVKLTPTIKPRKKLVNIQRTAPVVARAKKLAHLRRKPAKVANLICRPKQKFIQQAQYSLCQTAASASASITAANAFQMLSDGGLNTPVQSASPAVLSATVSKAVESNPLAAPAILAYVFRNIDPSNKDGFMAAARAAYQAAPNQAAGLSYASVSSNPQQSVQITQALLTAAPESDSAIIRQCALDANPNMPITTAAYIPDLGDGGAVGQNDIRHHLDNPFGREPDGSPI